MTKHVEIWTLSNESRVVPYMADFIDLYEYYPPPDMYVMDGKFEDRVERRHMDIIQVTKCPSIYDRMEMDSRIERSDKYIAIHPDVEEAISVKWQEKLDKIISDARVLNNVYHNLLDKVQDFHNLPWYKRVWRALTNQI